MALRKDRAVDGLALTLLVAGTGVLARKATEKVWTVAANKPPPRDESDLDVDMREALTWAVTSGIIVGLARLVARRAIARRAIARRAIARRRSLLSL